MKKIILVLLLLLVGCEKVDEEKGRLYTFNVEDRQGQKHQLSFYESDIEVLGNFDKAYENITITKDNYSDYFEISEEDIYPQIYNEETSEISYSNETIGTGYVIKVKDNKFMLRCLKYLGYNAQIDPYPYPFPTFLLHIKGFSEYTYYNKDTNRISFQGSEVIDKEVYALAYSQGNDFKDIICTKSIKGEEVLLNQGMSDERLDLLYSETVLDSVEVIDIIDALEVSLFDGNLIKWYEGNDGIIYCPLFKNNNLFGVIYYFDSDNRELKYGLAIRKEIDKQYTREAQNASLDYVLTVILE